MATFFGSNGNDTLLGTADDDILLPGLGTDTVDGGAGEDLLIVDYSSLDATYSLRSNFSFLSQYNYAAYSSTGYHSIDFSGIERVNVLGTAGNDRFAGTNGDDTLNGGAGNDTLDGGLGNDIINGGTGDDSIQLSAGTDVIDGGDGIDGVLGLDFSTATTNLIFSDATLLNTPLLLANGTIATSIELYDGFTSGSGNDTVIFTRQRDNVTNTGDGDDTINTGFGNDRVDGGAGNDLLIVDYSTLDASYSLNSYTSFFGSANYTAASTTGGRLHSIDFSNIERVQVTATSGNDRFSGTTGNDTLLGGAGNDTISAGGGVDVIDGGDGIDAIQGIDLSSATADLAFTDAVNLPSSFTLPNGTVLSNVEFLDGGTTGSGNDLIEYSGDRDNGFFTGAGNDTINAGLGYDLVDGGDGEDLLIVDYSSLNTAVSSYSFSAGNGVFFSYSSNPFEGDQVSFSNIERFQVIGSTSHDYIETQDGADLLIGGAGNDTLVGAGGNDTFVAGAGNDVITGGTGNDIIQLGFDGYTDTINYTLGDGVDLVQDFHLGRGGDIVHVSGMAAIDIVNVVNSSGWRIELHSGDGIARNAGFGQGDLLMALHSYRPLTPNDVGLNFTSADSTSFLLA